MAAFFEEVKENVVDKNRLPCRPLDCLGLFLRRSALREMSRGSYSFAIGVVNGGE